ncbi:MAG: helix-turn-helix domain-containing protein [Blautia wexlerae]
MVKAIKVMLIPNNVQKTKMFQYAGASRFAYNWALAREIENYEKGGKFISDAELRKEFTKLRHSDEYAWLLNISNNVTKQAIKDACTAYKNFFKGLQKFPRFKSKRDQCRSSIRTTLRYNSVIPTLNLKAFLPAGKQISKK